MAGHSEGVSDADLQAAIAGDEAAFARLYRGVQPGLLRYVSVIVGPDAEDVCGETWLQACRDLARFNGDLDSFRGWIARIARNRAIDHARARQRRPAVPVEALEGEALAESGEQVALEHFSTEQAMQAIRSLPRDQAEAVLLRAVLGLDAKTAGKVLGKRPGAVRTAAYRGLRALAGRLEQAAEDAEAARHIPPS